MSGEAVRFGLSRAHGGAQLLEGARRLTNALQRRIALPVRLIVADDYEHLLEGTRVGGVDLAWMPPLVHLRATAFDALLAAVCRRRGALLYRSALLVRADSPYAGLADLRGARAAWTDPHSASGYLFPRLALRAAGLDPRLDLGAEAFLGSPAAALTAVVDGRADLCACYVSDAAADDPARALADIQRSFAPAGWRLRVVGFTESIPPDGMVLGAAVDGEVQARLRDALLLLHEKDDGRAALDQLLQADRLAPVTADVVRAIEELRNGPLLR